MNNDRLRSLWDEGRIIQQLRDPHKKARSWQEWKIRATVICSDLGITLELRYKDFDLDLIRIESILEGTEVPGVKQKLFGNSRNTEGVGRALGLIGIGASLIALWSMPSWLRWLLALTGVICIVVGIRLAFWHKLRLGYIRLQSLKKKLFVTAIKVWLGETLVSGLNFFVLMNLVYEPRWGKLVAHQIGMSTRIVYIFIFAYFLLRYVKKYTTKDLILVGILWLALEEMFEWGGSFLLRRPVSEILVGWNILAGYMWPYVMATYLFANLIV